ncbi:MAG TPA: hypothetical protein VK501_04440 [Baekduia sp.]|uniref:hypothetical protein n=1 Tax=Baekduia sp. TaxID=2600305 RepID=UPI002CCAFACD|nr:hypothetical protein [Baekduia sp.]HMJ33146.1 hypothetical protein [Baekduia sp.]
MSPVISPERIQDEPWWYGPCRDAIQQMGAKMCDEVHCAEAEQQNHKICYCESPWLDGCKKLGHGDPSCCSYDATSPVFVSGPSPCYCCCGCFADETHIATTSVTETRQIGDFVVGDPVWVAMDADLKSWAEVPVAFSAGTGKTAGVNSLIRIRYGSAEQPESVYANRDQLFMLADHKLKRTVKLVPGVDELVRPDGSTVPVLDMAAGRYRKGVHHISTTTDPGKGVAGHLLVANGLVGGDYALQLQDLELDAPDVLVDGHAELPDFGTAAYVEAYPQLAADEHGAAPEGRDATEVSAGFVPFGVAEVVPVPEDARSFVTHEQALDIQKNGKAYPVYTGSAQAMLEYLFSVYSGFNPSVMFRVDDGNEIPNAYAFRQFDVPFVVINGGLARQTVLSLEGLALIIGQALGHLYGGDPYNDQGYSCTGVADFAATGAFIPETFFGSRSRPIVEAGMVQVRELFNLIDIDHRGGVPGDTCTYISIDCRLAALEAGADSKLLPECAGGPPTATLEVVGAELLADETGVAVSFNETLDPATVTVAAFDFAPPEPATKATLDATGKVVTIEVALELDTSYKVTAVTVLSAAGHGLVPDKDWARFKTPKGDGAEHGG